MAKKKSHKECWNCIYATNLVNDHGKPNSRLSGTKTYCYCNRKRVRMFGETKCEAHAYVK